MSGSGTLSVVARSRAREQGLGDAGTWPPAAARLERIQALKDSAGLSLAEIRQLLDAETVRERIRQRHRASDDPVEKRSMLAESKAVLQRQLALIERKRRVLDELAAEYQE